MALDPRIKKALNDFHKSQPALNVSEMPFEHRGIMLGDIIDEMMANIAVLAAKLDVDTGVTSTDYTAESVGNDDPDQLG